MTISMNTRAYEYEYGKTPRGYGYWGFTFEGYEFWHKGTFTEAKKACIKAVREKAPEGYTGHVEIKVLT